MQKSDHILNNIVNFILAQNISKLEDVQRQEVHFHVGQGWAIYGPPQSFLRPTEAFSKKNLFVN